MNRRAVVVAAVAVLTCAVASAGPLPGTQPLTMQGDIASQMVDGIDRFLLRETAETLRQRKLVVPDRTRFVRIIGAADRREPDPSPQVVAAPGE